jgi:hypothetical protein
MEERMLNGIELTMPATQLSQQVKAQEQVNKALVELASELAAGKSEKLLSYLKFLSRFTQYSFGNAFLIAIQRPDATLVAGRGSWEKVGRVVKEGEMPIGIFAPMTKAIHLLDMESDEDAEGERLLGFKLVRVFDVSSTEGRPLAAFHSTLGDATYLVPSLERVISDADIRVVYESLPFGTNGWTDGETISVRQELGSAEKFRCLAHELAHCLLGHVGSRRKASKLVRETEAEAVAFVVCHAVGIDSRDRSRDYIHLWDGSTDTLMQSLTVIQRVAGRIIAELRNQSGIGSNAELTTTC